MHQKGVIRGISMCYLGGQTAYATPQCGLRRVSQIDSLTSLADVVGKRSTAVAGCMGRMAQPMGGR